MLVKKFLLNNSHSLMNMRQLTFMSSLLEEEEIYELYIATVIQF